MLYDKVKEACKDSGIAVSTLEEKLGFPRSSLYKWNNHTPSAEKLMIVAKELNKPIEYFLG